MKITIEFKIDTHAELLTKTFIDDYNQLYYYLLSEAQDFKKDEDELEYAGIFGHYNYSIKE